MNAQPEPANVHPGEIHRFNQLAHKWWDPNGEFRPLHEINPLRLNYIEERAPLYGLNVLDVGCGGGILSEGMAFRGARVTGIDLAADALQVARDHAAQWEQEVEYREIPVETLAAEQPGEWDVVTCLEMLEHVPDPAAVIRACATLVRPGGHLFFSTINRNPKSFLLAIVGAEYLLNLIPRGTHAYEQFIRPSELGSWIRDAGLVMHDLTGMTYNPLTGRYRLDRDTDVNYLVHASRPA